MSEYSVRLERALNKQLLLNKQHVITFSALLGTTDICHTIGSSCGRKQQHNKEYSVSQEETNV